MILKDGSVILRPVEEKDSLLIYRWFNDEDIVKGLVNVRVQMSLKEAYDWCDNAARQRNKDIKWIIEVKNRVNMIVGFTGLYNIDFVNKNAESAILIGNKNYWGMGIGQKALKLKINFSFDYLGLNLVYAYILQNNEASIKLYEKLGFEKEGVLRKRVYRYGKWNDLVILSLLRSKWKN